jgi:hypothetical protein
MLKNTLAILHSAVLLLLIVSAQPVWAESAGNASVQKQPTRKSTVAEDEKAKSLEQRRAEYMAAYNAMPDTEGTGPYPALMEVDAGLPDHVIYRPIDLTAFDHQKKLGLLLWGNGGCTDDGASARLHLAEIASHGYLVIASGRILTGPSAARDAPEPTFMSTTEQDMEEGLDWALAEQLRTDSRFNGRLDPEAVAVSGHSCGGMLAIILAADPRVQAAIIHNSGLFPNNPRRPSLVTDPSMLLDLHTPVLYLVGNSSDVGYPVATEDFSNINHVPVMFASLGSVGHEGTFKEANGGMAASVAVDWLEWQLHGSEESARKFVGPECRLCNDNEWTVRKKGF